MLFSIINNSVEYYKEVWQCNAEVIAEPAVIEDTKNSDCAWCTNKN
jgi:hypothetical protein